MRCQKLHIVLIDLDDVLQPVGSLLGIGCAGLWVSYSSHSRSVPSAFRNCSTRAISTRYHSR